MKCVLYIYDRYSDSNMFISFCVKTTFRISIGSYTEFKYQTTRSAYETFRFHLFVASVESLIALSFDVVPRCELLFILGF
jgi:hypothetical protein